MELVNERTAEAGVSYSSCASEKGRRPELRCMAPPRWAGHGTGPLYRSSPGITPLKNTVSMLQVRRLKLREFKQFAQHCTAHQWGDGIQGQSWWVVFPTRQMWGYCAPHFWALLA